MAEELAKLPKAKGGQRGGRPKIDGSRSEPSIQPPTLAELGLKDRKRVARARRLAALANSAGRPLASR